MLEPHELAWQFAWLTRTFSTIVSKVLSQPRKLSGKFWYLLRTLAHSSLTLSQLLRVFAALLQPQLDLFWLSPRTRTWWPRVYQQFCFCRGQITSLHSVRALLVARLIYSCHHSSVKTFKQTCPHVHSLQQQNFASCLAQLSRSCTMPATIDGRRRKSRQARFRLWKFVIAWKCVSFALRIRLRTELFCFGRGLLRLLYAYRLWSGTRPVFVNKIEMCCAVWSWPSFHIVTPQPANFSFSGLVCNFQVKSNVTFITELDKILCQWKNTAPCIHTHTAISYIVICQVRIITVRTYFALDAFVHLYFLNKKACRRIWTFRASRTPGKVCWWTERNFSKQSNWPVSNTNCRSEVPTVVLNLMILPPNTHQLLFSKYGRDKFRRSSLVSSKLTWHTDRTGLVLQHLSNGYLFGSTTQLKGPHAWSRTQEALLRSVRIPQEPWLGPLHTDGHSTLIATSEGTYTCTNTVQEYVNRLSSPRPHVSQNVCLDYLPRPSWTGARRTRQKGVYTGGHSWLLARLTSSLSTINLL